MARRKQTADPALPDWPPGLIDQLAAGVKTPADFQQVYRAFQKALTEKGLQAERTHHLGYPVREGRAPDGNARNGTTPKRVATDTGTLDLAIPRDRDSAFAPQFVPKGVRRLPGFDETVLALYARGLTTRELQGYLEERYQVAVSPDLISTVTNAVLDEVAEWQSRPLEPVYIAVVFDALRVKIRGEGVVQNKAVYLALGVQPDGTKEGLGLWIAQTEGASFWHRVFSELQNRGVQDILVAMIDGLAGRPDALHAVFPRTVIHQCVVHLVRQSLQYVGWTERKAVAADLRKIYQAPTEGAALDVRRVLYTTNAIESLNSYLRKPLRTRGHFPNDDAATTLLYLVLRTLGKKWKQRPAKEWQSAVPHLRLLFGDRFPTAI